MYRLFIVPLLFSAVALARPQTPADTSALAGLPACAQDAANSALGSSGCATTDKKCICSSQPFIAAITTAVTKTCTAQDVQAALIFGQSFCGTALSGAGSASTSASASGGGMTSASGAPMSSPSMTDSDDSYYGASTTTVPGTMTATTSIAGATDPAMMSALMSSSMMSDSSMTSMMASGTMMTTTQCTTTTTVMTTAAKTMGYNATFTGAAVKNAGQGMMAAVIGVAGAVALL